MKAISMRRACDEISVTSPVLSLAYQLLSDGMDSCFSAGLQVTHHRSHSQVQETLTDLTCNGQVIALQPDHAGLHLFSQTSGA